MSPQTDFHGVAVITGAASGMSYCLQTTSPQLCTGIDMEQELEQPLPEHLPPLAAPNWPCATLIRKACSLLLQTSANVRLRAKIVNLRCMNATSQTPQPSVESSPK